MTPRLSIIIAAYNEAAYVADQLRAITQQIRGTRFEAETEIVFVDDGSCDTTFEIAIAFRNALLPGMRVIRNDQNQGCARSTNFGASVASGEYFYIASANDVMQPRAVLSIFEALEAFDAPLSAPGGLPEKRVDVIVGDVSGIHLGWSPDYEGASVSPRYIGPEATARHFGRLGIIHAAGVVVSRRAWDVHGGWTPDFWPYSETLSWHTMACRYGVVYTPNEFGWVRQHDGSASKTVLDREWRRPLMGQAADFVMHLEEPTRSRLIGSNLWDIAEWAPDMRSVLADRIARQWFHPRYCQETGGIVDRQVAEAFGVVAMAEAVISE